MAVLTKEQILSAEDLPTESVEVPEWGGSVLVRGLTGKQRDKFEASVTRGQGRNLSVNMEGIRSRLVSLSVVDDKGDRVFSDSDIDALGKKSAQALNRVFSVAQRLSGLTEEEVEALAENLAEAPSGNSTSG